MVLNFFNKNEIENFRSRVLEKNFPQIDAKNHTYGGIKIKMKFDSESIVSFKDVIGLDETKEECFKIIKFLKYPEKFKKIGAIHPKGLLLIGEPGTGKTLLARAIATEAGVFCLNTAGSEFNELRTGVGSFKIKNLFKRANLNSPSIIFIDEIDSIARKRDNFSDSDEYNKSLNQLLIEMDGFYSKNNTILIGATNNIDLLDPAILRPGRFDFIIHINLPNHLERINILKYYISNTKLAQKLNLDSIAQSTDGFTGADLENLINETNILLVKTRIKKIAINNLNKTIKNIICGTKTETLKNSKLIYKHAYYEIGRGVLSFVLKNHKDIYNITLVTRPNENSSIEFLSKNVLFLKKQSQFISEIVSIFGGYLNKNFIFGLNETITPFNNDLINIILEIHGEIGFSELRTVSIPDDLIFSSFESKFVDNDIDIFNTLNFCSFVASKLIYNNRLIIDILVDELLVTKTLEISTLLKILF
jgi:cell division protease FtsH